MFEQRPTLILIAGPNGSGKTTLAMQLQRAGWLGDTNIINPDEIAQQQFGDWNSESSIKLAVEEASRLRESALAAKQPLAFQTVLSSPDKLAFLARCKNAGYFVRFFYICTDSPEINMMRIQSRVMAGGHDVPAEKVSSRYPKSLAFCSTLLLHLDRGYVFDNSVENEAPKLAFVTVEGRVTKVHNKDHAWANSIVKALAAKR